MKNVIEFQKESNHDESCFKKIIYLGIERKINKEVPIEIWDKEKKYIPFTYPTNYSFQKKPNFFKHLTFLVQN